MNLSSFEIFVALYISFIWIIIWISFYVQDVALAKMEHERGIVHNAIPTDRRIIIYSGLLIICLTLFYSSIYIELGMLRYVSSFFSDFLKPFYPSVYLKYIYQIRTISLVFVCIGAVCMIKSRMDLKSMTSKEVAFSLNNKKEKQVQTGFYSYMRHPMYLGIILITFCSLILFPTFLGVILCMCIVLCILRKVRIESTSIK